MKESIISKAKDLKASQDITAEKSRSIFESRFSKIVELTNEDSEVGLQLRIKLSQIFQNKITKAVKSSDGHNLKIDSSWRAEQFAKENTFSTGMMGNAVAISVKGMEKLGSVLMGFALKFPNENSERLILFAGWDTMWQVGIYGTSSEKEIDDNIADAIFGNLSPIDSSLFSNLVQ